MTSGEFILLQCLAALEERGERPTTKNLAQFNGFPSKQTGYRLRSLERRGLVEVAGRAHGGARKWRPTPAVRELIAA